MSRIHTLLPSRPLTEFVRCYLYYDAQIGTQTVVSPVWPTPHVTLSFLLNDICDAFEYRTGSSRTLPAAFVAGPSSRRIADMRLHGRHTVFVVVFQPAGFGRLFHVKANELTDYAYSAIDVIGTEIRTVHASLRDSTELTESVCIAERFLSQRIGTALPADSIQQAATHVHDTHGHVRFADIVRTSGHGSRQFGRKFVQQLGLTPKLYARIVRLNFALRLKTESPSLSWTVVSHEAGYFDQNHLVKECKALTSTLPTRYFQMVAQAQEPLLAGA